MGFRLAVLGAVFFCLFGCVSRERSGARDQDQVDRLLSQMSLDERISLLHGVPEPDQSDQGEAGYLPGIPRLHIPPMRFADGPPGVLTRYPATALTATMGLAATFSLEDARANGVVIARDARSHGIDVVLQPFINIHRDQTFARSYNTYGEDPLLTGAIGAQVIAGIQGEGVMAQAKHFVGYDGANDVTVDEQTLHEIYLAPFAAAIDAQVASIMCGYNVINGAYACGNHALLTDVLRGEMKFDGFVTSDWGAIHSTPYIEAGDDLEMPGSGTAMESFFEARLPPPGVPRKTLLGPLVNPMPEEAATPVGPPTIITLPMGHPTGVLTALQDGSVSAATITRAVRRVLLQRRRFGRLQRDDDAPLPNGEESERERLANAAVVLKTSQDAAVLLKNESDALPLTPGDLSSLALIGPGGMQNIAVGESGEKALGFLPRQVSPLAALSAAGARIDAAVADDMDGSVMPVQLQRLDAQGHVIAQDTQLDFTLAHGNALPAGIELSWSGSLQIPRAGSYRLYLQVLGASAVWEVDGQRLGGTGPLQTHGNILQPGQDNVLASRDGLDNVRRELQLSAGAHAIKVKLTGEKVGQPVQVRLAWVSPEQRRADYQHAIDAARHANKVVLFAWSRNRPSFALPGDQDQLIADVAAVNPNTIVVLNISEPIAMPWLDQVKAVLLMWYPGDEGGQATANVLTGRVSPAGRLPFTWPKLLQQNVANDPAHPERSSAGVEGKTRYSEGLLVGYRWFDAQRLAPLFPFGYGRSYTHFDYSDLEVRGAADGGLEVSMQLRNSGPVAGDEVAQLYLGAPSHAPPGVQFASRALAAFERVHLAAGESRRVLLHVAPRALQFWSTAQQAWVRAPGAREVYVGGSERDLPLTAPTCDHPGRGCVLNTGSVADR